MKQTIFDFRLQGSDGDTYTPKDFKTPKVLFYFYPKDNTPGCTLEGKDFTRLQDDFAALGITIVGVSPDTIESHEVFCEKQDLGILLLSDPEKVFATAMEAYGEKTNYGRKFFGIIRSTFLVDVATGDVLKSWKNVKATGHAERVLKALK